MVPGHQIYLPWDTFHDKEGEIRGLPGVRLIPAPTSCLEGGELRTVVVLWTVSGGAVDGSASIRGVSRNTVGFSFSVSMLLPIRGVVCRVRVLCRLSVYSKLPTQKQKSCDVTYGSSSYVAEPREEEEVQNSFGGSQCEPWGSGEG